MILREATVEDLQAVAEHSISRGLKHVPSVLDFVYCIDEGGPLAVGGLRLLTPRVAIAWIDLSERALDYTKSLFRQTKEWLDLMIATHELKVIEAYVEPDFPQAIAFVNHLGFKLQSEIPRFYADDKTGLLYVRQAI